MQRNDSRRSHTASPSRAGSSAAERISHRAELIKEWKSWQQ
jgi:hypothetical protein